CPTIGFIAAKTEAMPFTRADNQQSTVVPKTETRLHIDLASNQRHNGYTFITIKTVTNTDIPLRTTCPSIQRFEAEGGPIPLPIGLSHCLGAVMAQHAHQCYHQFQRCGFTTPILREK